MTAQEYYWWRRALMEIENLQRENENLEMREGTIEIGKDAFFESLLKEMADKQIRQRIVKVHTDNVVGEFEIKLMSIEFKERKI